MQRSRILQGFTGEHFFHQFVQDQATLSSAPNMRLFGLFRHGFEDCVGACKHGLRIFHRLHRVLMTAGLMPQYPPLIGSDGRCLPLPYCGILSVGSTNGWSWWQSLKPRAIERRKSLDIDVYQAEPIALDAFVLPGSSSRSRARVKATYQRRIRSRRSSSVSS